MIFARRRSYQSAVDEIAQNALDFDLMDAPGLNAQHEVGYMYNTLEGVAVKLFLSQRALSVVKNPDHFEKSRDRLARTFFLELEAEYSKSEMLSLVLPLLERRHLEYEAILDSAEEPGDRISQLGRTMLRNMLDREPDGVLASLATLFIVERLMMKPTRHLKSLLDKENIKF